MALAQGLTSKFSLDANPARSGFWLSRAVYAPPTDRIADVAASEHCISLHLANPGNLERSLERRLDGESIVSRPTSPGTFTFVPALRQAEWFWQAEVEILDLQISEAALRQIALESDRGFPSIELIDRFAIRDQLLEQLVLTLSAELDQGNTRDRLYCDSLQTLIAVHLLRHHCTAQVTPARVSGGLAQSQLRSILDYIHTHLDREICLPDLAAIVNLGAHHFGKLFKQSMGISPHQYVMRCRIERAQQLLGNPSVSLAEISQAVGFCDQSHFTNTFQRFTNLTPKQYRRQL